MLNNHTLERRLIEFRKTKNIKNKGALAVVVYISRLARNQGLPLNSDNLLTKGSGQVLGLGKGAIQQILTDHGISQVLAEEGGRTSRGSIGIMQQYVIFLNELHADGLAQLEVIEKWWIKKVKNYFTAKPFRLHYDVAKSLQAIIHDLLAQAKKRQQEHSGTMYQGAVLQHLIGAKLELLSPQLEIIHNGFSVADTVSDRAGDFIIDESILHITVSPGEAVIRKCQQNLDSGTKPIILTIGEGVAVAKGLAHNAELANRIEIMDAEQFLATNIHEISLFKTSVRRTTFRKLIEIYNRIVLEYETDPSLQIEVG